MKNKFKNIVIVLISVFSLFYVNKYLIKNELKNYKFYSAFYSVDSVSQDYKSTTWRRSVLSFDGYLSHETLTFNSDSLIKISKTALKLDDFYYLRKFFGEKKQTETRYQYHHDSSKNRLILTPLNEMLIIEGFEDPYRIDLYKDSLNFNNY